MTKPNDGGPAFPAGLLPGMSLRDWFAGRALEGLLACPNVAGSVEGLSDSAFEYADAMLKARGQDAD